jgi:hypothetical protein
MKTRSPDEPLYFGFIPTPHFSTFRLSEPAVLFLSKGLRLTIQDGQVAVLGGPELRIAVAAERQESSTDDEYLATLVDSAQDSVGAEVMAIANPSPDMVELQPLVSVFRTGQHLITAEMAAEELLSKMQSLSRAAMRKLRLLYGVNERMLYSARERCALLNDTAQDGHLDPTSFDSLLKELSDGEPYLERAFFLANLDDYCEGIRSAFLRASYHLSRMTFALHQINKLKPIEFVICDSDHGDKTPRELRHVSKLGDTVADEFASAALASYSSLDLVRKLFDFVMREPFGEARRIAQRHFMDKMPTSTPHYEVALPMALPILDKDQFKSLYLLRSDLIHNQGTDFLRPVIYWGVAQEPVNGHALQYVQYMSRDITEEGAPSTHKWLPRFFSQKRDSETFLGDELSRVLECAFETVEWLTYHLEQAASPTRR